VTEILEAMTAPTTDGEPRPCSRHAPLERRDVGSINSRLRRLEEHGHRCPECGLAPDERRPIAVINEEYPNKSFEGDPQETCSSCKEPLHTVIRVVYEGQEGGGDSYWPHAPA